MENQPLATYLRTHRKRAGLSQEDVAFLLGAMCGTSVSRHERGNRMPMLQTALMYEFVLGATVRQLYEGVFAQARFDVKKRARGLHASLARKPKTAMRDKKIALLARLISEEQEAA